MLILQIEMVLGIPGEEQTYIQEPIRFIMMASCEYTHSGGLLGIVPPQPVVALYPTSHHSACIHS